jgi:L-amino acid N-acyltransferase YncA
VADVAVRPARPADAPEIARVQLDTWRTAYRRFLPAGLLDGLTMERAAEAWAGAITEPPTPAHRVLVATEQDLLVGFVAVAPSDEADAGPDGAAIATLLVEPRWGRRGHGSRLLAAAVDHLRADGFDRMTAWVPDGDTASSRFYSSAGWEQNGTARTLEAEGGTVREARWHVSLAEPQAEPNEEQA